METIDWSKLSNSEIQLKQHVMKERYEYIKNQISSLMDELDLLDNEYISAEKILNKRLKRK